MTRHAVATAHVRAFRPGRGLLRRRAAPCIAATLLLAACAGTSAADGTSPSATPSPPSAAPSPTAGLATPASAATAHVTLVGGPAVNGSLTAQIVRCSSPSLDGTQIHVVGMPSDTSLSVAVIVRADALSVAVSSGSGSQFKVRTFSGSGVSGFDAAHGARIDSPLTDTAAQGAPVSSLPSVTSLRGDVDCGGQQPGLTSITLDAATADGAITGGLSPVRVECSNTAQGSSVFIVGIGHVGASDALIEIVLSERSVTVYEAARTATATHIYSATGPGVATLTAAGGHVAVDVAEAAGAGATGHTLHVAGDATCGSTVSL